MGEANRRCRCHQEHHRQGYLRYYHQGRTKGPKEEITRCTKGKWATYSRRSFFSPQQFFKTTIKEKTKCLGIDISFAINILLIPNPKLYFYFHRKEFRRMKNNFFTLF